MSQSLIGSVLVCSTLGLRLKLLVELIVVVVFHFFDCSAGGRSCHQLIGPSLWERLDLILLLDVDVIEILIMEVARGRGHHTMGYLAHIHGLSDMGLHMWLDFNLLTRDHQATIRVNIVLHQF